MQRYLDLAAYLDFLPSWAAQIVAAVIIAWTACMAGVALGRAGRSPMWAMLAFLPYVFTIGLWILALGRWLREPKRDGA